MTDSRDPEVLIHSEDTEPETDLVPMPEERAHAPRGAHAMAIVRWILVAVMAVVAVVSVAYSFGMFSTAAANAAPTQYYCPMHPQVVQDGPGECPICSMSLVPKASSASKQGPSAVTSAARSPLRSPSVADAKKAVENGHEGHRHKASDPYSCPMHPEETGADAAARCPICKMKLEKRVPATQAVPGLVPVELSMDRIQLIGVKTALALGEPLTPELRTVGLISADEAKLARVHARFSGWIEQLAVATTGQKVKRGQVLAGLYNPELLPAQEEYLAAQRWTQASPTTTGTPKLAPLEADARARLKIFGLSSGEIDNISKTGRPTRTVAVTAPIGGYVVRKNAVLGAYVQPGSELFEIADLSKVWVVADVYEHDISRVFIGQTARVGVAAYPQESLSGTVAFIYPVVDSATRTLRVRIELDNREQKLRPGMYADVAIRLAPAQGVVVPVEALVDTGEHQYVFLSKDGGRFEPRRVRAGARSGDKVQILEGVIAGEKVVTTANFLIDSESRLRAAIEAPSSSEGASAHAH